jgi:hypothetical protein
MSVFDKMRSWVLRVRSGFVERAVRRTVEILTADNVQQAMLCACFMTGAVVEAFTVAPYFEQGMRGCHRWVVEFAHRPDDMRRFTELLDECMRSLSRAYNAMRDGIISAPMVEQVPRMTFHRWQQSGHWDAVPCIVGDEQLVELLLMSARKEAEFRKK